jgi:hypothetical protein
MRSKHSIKGYTIIEFLAIIAAFAGLIAYTLPQIKSLKDAERNRKQLQVVSKLEGAKNMFDESSSPATRAKFDGSSDEARYELLAGLLNQPDPFAFIGGSGISRMKINRLGEDVEVD